MRRDVFQAIADPTRRQIIGLVALKSLNLNAISDQFEISRPAISKHIKILTECGLIEVNQKGRERHCKVRAERLVEVSEWVENFRQLWEARLDSFEEYLAVLQSEGDDENTN